jgi:hypothetical protein
MKIIIVLFLIGILSALALAGRAMLKDGQNGHPKSNRMVKALTWRIGLSIALFLLVVIAYILGWIQPTGLR